MKIWFYTVSICALCHTFFKLKNKSYKFLSCCFAYRGDKQRLGAAIAAYLEYLHICATNYPASNRTGGLNSAEDVRAQNTIARNWLDLDIFSMKKFLEDVIGPLRVPSHKRYLHYFSGLLSGKIKMNASPLYMRYVVIESPPSWLNYGSSMMRSDDDRPAEWRSFIKVYEGLNCVFTSGMCFVLDGGQVGHINNKFNFHADIHVIPIATRQFTYEVGQLRLRGDVIIRCYQIIPTNNRVGRAHQQQQLHHDERRELIYSTQFHTCAITEKTISFGRSELDYACDGEQCAFWWTVREKLITCYFPMADPRFPVDHKVTLYFEKSAHISDGGVGDCLSLQSPLVKIEPVSALAKYDSLENFDDGELNIFFYMLKHFEFIQSKFHFS